MISIAAMLLLAFQNDLKPSIGRVIRLIARWSCSTMLLWRKAQRVGHIPAQAGQHHLKRVVQPFKHLPQRAVDQTLAKVKQEQGYLGCLLQQSLN